MKKDIKRLLKSNFNPDSNEDLKKLFTLLRRLFPEEDKTKPLWEFRAEGNCHPKKEKIFPSWRRFISGSFTEPEDILLRWEFADFAETSAFNEKVLVVYLASQTQGVVKAAKMFVKTSEEKEVRAWIRKKIALTKSLWSPFT